MQRHETIEAALADRLISPCPAKAVDYIRGGARPPELMTMQNIASLSRNPIYFVIYINSGEIVLPLRRQAHK